MNVKCISLWQPWASLFAAGIKKIETRSWETSHRGPLLVHAAKIQAPAGIAKWHELQVYKLDPFGALRFEELPFGKIVGSVHIDDVRPTEELLEEGIVLPNTREFNLGDYGLDRFGWLSSNHRLCRPVAAVGRQKVFNLDVTGMPNEDVDCLALVLGLVTVRDGVFAGHAVG